jgi:uncharacterized protein (DUF2237 family)
MNNLYLVLILTLLVSYYIYTCIIENLENNKVNNILGTPMIPCCATGKVTGFYRDGNCSTGDSDTGTHVVCAIMDDNFLQFTKTKGNDLSTPRLPSFPGLVAGDKWCICISRWLEAYKAGKAPKIIPESTNEVALKYTTKDILLKYT